MKYYTLDNILTNEAIYYVIVGERSNGKTTAVLTHILENFFENGERGAIIRRWKKETVYSKASTMFNGIVDRDLVYEMSGGKYDSIKYRSGGFYLVSNYDDDGNITEPNISPEPFCYLFSLTEVGDYKSTSYPGVTTIVYDEFIPLRNDYHQNEVSLFLNMVSTIVREKAVAKVFLVANTVTWNSPYFKAFGITGLSRLKPGTIAKYSTEREIGLRSVETPIVLEYCENTAEYGGKPSDVYFTISDERTAMITDGVFAIPKYPTPEQAGVRYNMKNTKFQFWVMTGDNRYRGRFIVTDPRNYFVYVDNCDDPLYDILIDEKRDLFYSLTFTSNVNHFPNPASVYKDPRTRYIAECLDTNRFFFDNNETGENFTYYVRQASGHNVFTI